MTTCPDTKIKSPKGNMSRVRRHALSALNEAILAADPRIIIRRNLQIRGSWLKVADSLFLDLKEFERIFVIGGGKASALMAEEVEKVLGSRITAGLINIPDYVDQEPKLKKITLNKASHPVPNKSGQKGVERMLRLTNHLTTKDLVICLISGGGSALMPLPAAGITLEDKQKVTSLLLKSGAEIHDINSVRKHLSGVKGGRLAERLQPAIILSLIISDVVGDDLSSIASGPTVPDSTIFQEAMRILKEKYEIWNKIPRSARKIIEKGVAGKIEETPKPGSKIFQRVHNILIGSNKRSCEAAYRLLKKAGYRTMILTSRIEGEAAQVGGILASIASDISTNNLPIAPPAAVIAGGETTVKVKGSGKGGRNQEVVLAASLGISGLENVTIASAGTDGVDGPTDAAGAIADGKTIERALGKKLDAREYLYENDSYNFFKKLDDLIITGPTGTNVNDIMVAVVAT